MEAYVRLDIYIYINIYIYIYISILTHTSVFAFWSWGGLGGVWRGLRRCLGEVLMGLGGV